MFYKRKWFPSAMDYAFAKRPSLIPEGDTNRLWVA